MRGSAVEPIRLGLADPYLKTTRAKEHLGNLRDELKVFYESKPYSFTGEDDLEHERYRLHFEIRDAPDKIALIVGDLFYCLRSSLDQLVWILAKLNLPYPEHTYFPILEEPDAKRFARCTNGVPTEAVRIIESLQPHHGVETAAIRSHLLWRLNKMCNIDKHRRIPVHGSVADFRWPGPIPPIVELENDKPMLSVPAAFKAQMTLDPTVSFKVVFGDLAVGISVDLEGIERIYNFVTDDVLPRFAGFFK